MKRKFALVLLTAFCISMNIWAIDAWIRINQVGYLPNSLKRAVLLSESSLQLNTFTIHDALTDNELAKLTTVHSKGEFYSYKSTYILDFSSFNMEGAFYIKAGLIYSPIIYINKNIALGSADFLLNYMRQQRCGENVSLGATCHQFDGYEIYGEKISEETNPCSEIKIAKTPKISSLKSGAPKPITGILKTGTLLNKPIDPLLKKKTTLLGTKKSITDSCLLVAKKPVEKHIDVRGGWHDASDYLQYSTTSANAVFQMLFAYQMNPTAFADKYDALGNKTPNNIPDILDEAKWGLDWLSKMYPGKEIMYHQIADDRDHAGFRLPSEDKVDYGWGPGTGRPVYRVTGEPQGLFKNKNRSTGVASIAGKYASAFALGSDLLAKYYPTFADSIKQKALEAYQYGKSKPGVCQTAPGTSPYFYEEDNWTDDMELAATQLYRLTYDSHYLKEAAAYGRMEPVTPWMCSDTARHYQWYPFINLGHYMLSNVENPRYQKEFQQNILNGIQRISLKASENPFNVSVPFIWCSNNLVTAIATQCRLYRTITKDSTYLSMETSLYDWLLGCNPWGASMVVGMPNNDSSPNDPHSSIWQNNRIPIKGGLVDGPVYGSIYNSLLGVRLSKEDAHARFQSSWAVYHDDHADYSTNEPTMDGTAALTYLLSSKQVDGASQKTSDNNEYNYGGITRTDPSKKQISIVFTGHEYADGYKIIKETLKKLHIRASFFFTGDFYRKRKFAKIIKGLKEDHHYLGAHSNKHLLYATWERRDSSLVNRETFLNDLKGNYEAMEKFDIEKSDAPFFLPAYEWYNESTSRWCKEVGINLVNFTPGTLSNADYTIPEMREKYYSSNEIYNKILDVEAKQGLNGHILLFHFGTDKQREDKFYPNLYPLLLELSKRGYDFVDLFKATDLIEEKTILPTTKNKKKKN